MKWAIEYLDPVEFGGEEEASQRLQFLALQVDFLGGRILPRNGDVPWRVQAFFEDVGETPLLPMGCARRLVPDGLLRRVGR